MDKKKILDWLVQEAESKAQKHYQRCYHRTCKLTSLQDALWWLNDQPNQKGQLLPDRLPQEPSKMIPVLKKHFNNKVSFISLVLHHHFPREYFFYRPSKLDKEIVAGLDFFSDVVPEFGLPFSQVGGRNLRNYLRLNEALLSFARGRWPRLKNYQERLMYFLYEGLGRPFQSGGLQQRYWLMAAGPDYFEHLDAGRRLDWTGGKDIQVGDVAFMYRTRPRAAITDLYRVTGGPYFTPWAGWGGFDVDMKKICRVDDIPFSEMRSDKDIGEWSVVRKFLVGTRAEPIPPLVCNSLLRRIPDKVRDDHGLKDEAVVLPPEPSARQPTLATPRYAGRFASEEEFEEKVILPLLKRWGFARKAQHSCRYRTSSKYRTGLVDFLVSDQGERLTLFEDKRQIVNDKELQPYVDQAKTYALLLALPSFVVASPQGMWLYALDADQEQLIKPIPTAGTHKQQEDKFKSLLLQLRK